MADKKDTGIIVGRFQTGCLDEELKRLIKTIIENHEQAAVILGEAPVPVTRNNPLDFDMRKEMLLAGFPALTILPIADAPADVEWSQNLDKLIAEKFPGPRVTLYGTRERFIKHYTGAFESSELPEMREPENAKPAANEKMKATPEFRAGVVFAVGKQYPKVYPTVDVAIVKEGKLLLGRKSNQQAFRFIGGFTDPDDNSYEEAAAREAREETKVEITNIRYAGSAKIDDWRYRNEADKIITHLFIADYATGTPVASDDIAELNWFDIATIRAQDIVAEHHVLLNMFLKFMEFPPVCR